jgi:nitrogen fixation protein FixH
MNRFLILLFLTAALCGCQRAAEPERPKVAPAEPFQMELQVAPEKPLANQPATLRLTLRDEKGELVSGVRVTADLGMPFHDMGEKKVEFAEKGSGIYEAPAKFTMEGPWEAHVTAEQGGKSAKKSFDLRVYE